MIKKAFLAALAATAALVALTPATAAAGSTGEASRTARCASQFDAAQRLDMTSFRDFEEKAFRDAHDRRAVSIYGGSHVDDGRAQIMATLHDHFADRNAVWSWTELTRHVYGCRTAVIVYRTTYAIPSQDYSSELVTAVTYSYVHGRWLGVLDQSTPYRAGS